MIRAACHCGAVRIVLERAPEWVLDCNCSICRRLGGLWAYAWDRLAERDLKIEFVQGADAVEAYVWGDRELGFWRCRTCGCHTHHTLIGEPDKIRGVNVRMCLDLDPATVRVERADNGHTGWFWTRPDGAVWKSPWPPDPPRGPDDWR